MSEPRPHAGGCVIEHFRPLFSADARVQRASSLILARRVCTSVWIAASNSASGRGYTLNQNWVGGRLMVVMYIYIYIYRNIACTKRRTTMLCAEKVVTSFARTESSYTWKLTIWKAAGEKSVHCWDSRLCGVCIKEQLLVKHAAITMQPSLRGHMICLCLFFSIFSKLNSSIYSVYVWI